MQNASPFILFNLISTVSRQCLASSKYSIYVCCINEIILREISKRSKASPHMNLELNIFIHCNFSLPAVGHECAKGNYPHRPSLLGFLLPGYEVARRPLSVPVISVVFFQSYILDLIIICNSSLFKILIISPCLPATSTTTAFQLHQDLENSGPAAFFQIHPTLSLVPSTSNLNSYFLFSSCLLPSNQAVLGEKNTQQSKCDPL